MTNTFEQRVTRAIDIIDAAPLITTLQNKDPEPQPVPLGEYVMEHDLYAVPAP